MRLDHIIVVLSFMIAGVLVLSTSAVALAPGSVVPKMLHPTGAIPQPSAPSGGAVRS